MLFTYKTKLPLFLTTLFLLTGCGGSDGEPTKKDIIQVDTTKKEESRRGRRGHVIDGYVSGATVWLDLNNNGEQDEGEPSTQSTDKGFYQLELSEKEFQCSQYVPLIVDVPVGAIDEDLGEVEVPYQMVFPPQFEALDDDAMVHITPLTTVLWQTFSNLPEFKNKTCEQLIESQSIRETLLQELDTIIRAIVDKYNLSEQRIYADYIATQDDEAKALAESIVRGLQASFNHQQALKEIYPQASEIRVLHHQDKAPEEENAEGLVWYRETVVFTADDSEHFYKNERLNDDLDEVLYIQYDRYKVNEVWQKGTYSLTQDRRQNGPDAKVECFLGEGFQVKEGNINYKLSNSYTTEPNDNQCEITDSFTVPDTRLLFVEEQNAEITDMLQVEQRFYDGSLLGLADWYNFRQKAESLKTDDLVQYLKHAGYKFDEDMLLSAFYWFKRRTDDTGNRVLTERNSYGQWKRTVYNADNTYTEQCSTDGVNWNDCK